MSRAWIDRLAVLSVVLVLSAGWRPFQTSPSPRVLRSSAKGPRRSPPELPATSLSRCRKADVESTRAPEAGRVDLEERGPLTTVAPGVRARVSDCLGRPRYLQAYRLPDPQGTLAPPLA